MRIISKKAITTFSRRHPDAAAPLKYWYRIASSATWKTLSDAQADFPHADYYAPFTIFNVGGNNHRLIAVIKYRWQIVYIRHILTHAEYDKEKWKE